MPDMRGKVKYDRFSDLDYLRRLYFGEDTDDTVVMRRSDIIRRRFEARMMHRYGRSYLASIVDGGQFPTVMVGNPNQKIRISNG